MSFRQQLNFDALPNLPQIPGFKTIWLTSTNPRDTIAMRMRLGYVPVGPSDVPGWENLLVKSGEYEGLIGVNEMLAFKIPMELWLRHMTELHHNAPLEEEGKLKANVDRMRGTRDGSGNHLVSDQDVGDGTADLDNSRIKPRFD